MGGYADSPFRVKLCRRLKIKGVIFCFEAERKGDVFGFSEYIFFDFRSGGGY